LFKHIAKSVSKFFSEPNADLYDIVAHLIGQKFNIIDVDEKRQATIVGFEKPLCTVIYIDEDDPSTIRLESTMVFEAELANLRTMSSISHVAMSHGFGVSGLVPTESGRVKLYVMKYIDLDVMKKRLPDDVRKMYECLKIIISYINQRVGHKHLNELDLSMFSEIDISQFNPQLMGERKDFVYQSWEGYAESVLKLQKDPAIDGISLLEEIQACAKFEHKNQMHLSEVGNIVLDELVWNRNFIEAAAEGKFHIN
jgi:hypothetical protein